jgi:hypothetical protein
MSKEVGDLVGNGEAFHRSRVLAIGETLNNRFLQESLRPVNDVAPDETDEINCCKEAGVPGLLYHDLRRSAARNLRNAGVAEEIIMKIGGWKTPNVFKRYSIVDTKDMSDALAKLDRRREAEALLRAEQEQGEPITTRPI